MLFSINFTVLNNIKRYNEVIKYHDTKGNLSQSGNWIKYAVMERSNSELFYYCAIPKKETVPENFIVKDIKSHTYLVVEHRGAMDNLYNDLPTFVT